MLLLSESGKALFEDTNENIASIKDLSQKTTGRRILELIEVFLKSANLLKDISYPILPIEMAVIESCSQLSIINRNKYQIPKSCHSDRSGGI